MINLVVALVAVFAVSVAVAKKAELKITEQQEEERAGFEIELCSYVMSAILPAAMAVRLAERLRPRAQRPAESGYPPVPAFLNSLLTHLVGLDGYLVRWLRLPFGLSVLALARRPTRSG